MKTRRQKIIVSLLFFIVFIMGLVLSGRWPQYTLFFYGLVILANIVAAILAFQNLETNKPSRGLLLGVAGIIVGFLLGYWIL